MKIGSHFRQHFFRYILILLTVAAVFSSYTRFVVDKDYLVSYEGVCDPGRETCFIGCEDEECIEQYYYSKIEKYAQDLYAQCGKDTMGCEASNRCLPNDRECSIMYCDIELDGEDCEIDSEGELNSNPE